MPICKECKEVVGAMEIGANGVCKSCNLNEEEDDQKSSLDDKESMQKEEIKPLDDIYAVISFFLALIGFFILPIVLAPLALFLALQYSKRTIFAKIAIGLAVIELSIIALRFFSALFILSHS